MAEASGKPVVLVVEDNPVNMKLTVDLLELNGFSVLKAADGDQALQLLAAAMPALILLDLHLPGMDGFEVFQKIRANPAWAGCKIVALTASAMREDEEKIRNAGFTDYIAKPINTKQFVQKVKQLTA